MTERQPGPRSNEDDSAGRASSRPPDAAQLERAFASLTFTVKSASSTRTALAAPALADTAAKRLRFALALCGRRDPRDFLPTDLDSKARLAALDAVAGECDIDACSDSKLWLLKDTVRRRVLLSHSPADIASALSSMPARDDATTEALRALYVGPVPDLARLTLEQLRVLAAAVEWTDGGAPYQVDVDDVRRRASRRARDDDYRRLLKDGFFGRDAESQSLFEFVSRLPEPAGARLRHAHVWGSGGVGKSTLIAAVALRLLEHDPEAVLVHLDFDRSDLDPTRASMLDLEVLSQAGSVDPQIDEELKHHRERIRMQMGDELSADYADSKMRQTISAEGASAYSRSIVSDALWWLGARGKPLVLILDTAEQIDAGGSQFWFSLDAWLSELVHAGPHFDLRLVIAGRVEPASLSQAAPQEPALRMPLGDLTRDGSLELLGAQGIPEALAKRVFLTFGGNPLMLHLAANLIDKAGVDTLREFTKDAREGELPQKFVQGLLYDRFLKHIDDDDARQFAHPGLALPEITTALLQHVVAPAIGEEIDDQRAQLVFAGLRRATWLLTSSDDGQTLTPRCDIRALLMRLLKSDQSRADSVHRLRQTAAAYHSARTDIADRAFALYHRLMATSSGDDLDRFNTNDLRDLVRRLRPYYGDFPNHVRTFLEARTMRDLGPEDALTSLPDAAWASYLAGEEGQMGFGDQLVISSDPMIALSLWRRRRVGDAGQPPTFVLQALGETAEWDDPAADIHAIVQRVRDEGRPPDTGMIRRLTALTRLALLRAPAPLARDHVALLKSTLKASTSRERGLAELCAIASVAEALQETPAEIVPIRFLTGGEAFTSETRIYLVCARRFHQTFAWRPHLDALVTTQRDWASRIAAAGVDVGNDLASSQVGIDSIHGGPLDKAARVLESMRSQVRLSINTDNQPAAVLLLRGTTPEFHRPVRQALREALTTPELTSRAVTRFRQHLSICPKELEPAEFTSRAMRDPTTWFLAIAQFADGSRVLGPLLDCASEAAPHAVKLQRVRETWRAWDRAICGGLSSDWGAQTQGPTGLAMA